MLSTSNSRTAFADETGATDASADHCAGDKNASEPTSRTAESFDPPCQQQQQQVPESATPSSVSSTAKDALNRFAAETSAHGYRNLFANASQPLCLTIWLLLIVGTLGGLTFHINLIATQYFAYNKRVQIHKTVEALRFPTVQLCTTNFWSDFLMNQSGNEATRSLRNYLLNDSASLFPAGARDQHFQQELFVDQMLLENYFTVQRRDNSSSLKLLQVSTALDSVLLACKFNFQPCSAANFTLVATQEYGFCFNFQANLPLGSQFGSYNNGLMLTLALEGSTSSRFANEPSLAFTRGYVVKLVGHNFYPNTHRLPPFGVPVSFHTSIAMTTSRTQRLHTRATPCSNSQTVFDSFDIDGREAVEYSHSLVTCMDMLLSRHIYDTCSCVNSQLPVPMELADKLHCLEVGNLSSREDIVSAYQRHQCAQEELRSHSEASAYAKFIGQCLPSCQDMDIRVGTSRTLLPSMQSWSDDLLHLIKNQSENLIVRGVPNYLSHLYNISLSSGDSSYLLEHVCQLNIFFSGSTLDTFKEDLQYPIESFLSEAGGVIGLWTGASILTLAEFIELFGLLARICCFKICRIFNLKPQTRKRLDLVGESDSNNSAAAPRGTDSTKETRI